MIDNFNEVTIETLEVSQSQQRIAHWVIPATLPFNEFVKMIADKEKSKNIDIAIEGTAVNDFIIREKKYMQLN
jgi:hypothetical protein